LTALTFLRLDVMAVRRFALVAHRLTSSL